MPFSRQVTDLDGISAHDASRRAEALELGEAATGRDLHDCARRLARETCAIRQGLDECELHALGAERRELDGDDIGVHVDDDAGEPIALGVDEPVRVRVRGRQAERATEATRFLEPHGG